MIDTEKKYTPTEIARMFEVTPPAVYKWIKEGKLEGYKKVGRYYVDGLELKKFAEANNLYR